jgi:hypothetical protein
MNEKRIKNILSPLEVIGDNTNSKSIFLFFETKNILNGNWTIFVLKDKKDRIR